MALVSSISKDASGRCTLIVDGKPFLALGGEFHNSDASDLTFMEEQVWPAVRGLHGNCYLVPVYWELIEREEGTYDFSLLEGTIRDAGKEGVKLILLWFGLWKNGRSTYIPAWMKQDEKYFYLEDQGGRIQESVSPFCREAVDRDAAAFTALMEFLRGNDPDGTVIMIQVENEVGIWGGAPRDYGRAAEEAYEREIPQKLAAAFHVEGTWEQAFGHKACEYFMAWYYAEAVERIAAAGKAVYPLPMFMNSVPSEMGFARKAGDYPSGGPVPSAIPVWKVAAPHIDFYGPDIYSPNFREITDDYASRGPLLIPETGGGKDCAAKALFAVSAYNTLLFSPFGIEELVRPVSEADSLSQTNMDHGFPMYGGAASLSDAYQLLQLLWPRIREAQSQGRIYAFLDQGDSGADFLADGYEIVVTYQGASYEPGKIPSPGAPRKSEASIGGGFIIQDGDTFLLCAVSCNVSIRPAYGSRDQAFILDQKELKLADGRLVPGRTLNGDQRNYLTFGSVPGVQELAMYRRRR